MSFKLLQDMSTFKLCIKYFAFPREIDELSLTVKRVLRCFRFVGLQENIVILTLYWIPFLHFTTVFTNLNLTKKLCTKNQRKVKYNIRKLNCKTISA